MDLSNYLLTDDQMRQWISHGYLVLNTDFSTEFHDALNARIDEVMTSEGNPGNNFLPRIPEAQEVFKHPAIRGALTSVVGPGYLMHPHRHCHYTFPGRKVQSWHKDSYWGHQKVRNHHPWWAMIFYYPHDVDAVMGPSAVMPGTQYYDKRAGDDTEEPLLVEGKAGTFTLIHYDVWHRGSANNSERTRAMMKFQFVRMSAPTAPTWNNQRSAWQPMNGDAPSNSHESLWEHQWNWLSGRQYDPVAPADGEEQIGALCATIAGDYEPTAIDAAYRLAALNGAGITALQESLRSGDPFTARRAGYGLSAAGKAATAGLIDALSHETESARRYAAFALGELRDAEAAGALAAKIQDESENVRRTVVESLGIVGDAGVAVPALIEALGDEDSQVRFTTAAALTRLGAAAEEAVPALVNALKDEDRYVRANSVDALRQIGTPQALDAALSYLTESRWCYTTTKDNSF